MTQLTVSQISIYPIKSTAPIHQTRCFLDSIGAAFDRRFILVDKEGNMLTARKYPKLLQIKSALIEDGLAIHYTQKDTILLRYQDIRSDIKQSQVWGDDFSGSICHAKTNQWFSDILGIDATLLHLAHQSARFGQKANRHVSFADAYPLLIIGTASLDALNARSKIQHSMAQFRPNIVINTETPFIEDTWKRIRINGANIHVTEPCARCVLTTINPENSEKFANAEPIKTLSTFRKSADNAIHFGMNANVDSAGIINMGDVVEVIETQRAEVYQEIK